MKHLLNAVTNCTMKVFAPSSFLSGFKKSTATQLCGVIISGAFLFAGCTKHDLGQPTGEAQSANAATADEAQINAQNKTLEELKLARESTKRYQDINNAINDGYIDINVVMENMGYHYQKPEIVDSVFDIRHPELLVYNKNEDGTFKLVAVEYAVPLDQSVNAPRGFTGKQDVWDHNDDFGLWLLHAWVFEFNPDGVFNPTNPRVHVIMDSATMRMPMHNM